MAVPLEEIERAARLLREGRLVAFPTETVYGLGANAFDAAAVERVYEAKGRPAASPLIVHVDSVAMARTLSAEWPDAAEQLAARFWPGPLTLVLPKQPRVPDRVTAGLRTVAIRMPNHETALQLIRACGVPLAAPSANRFTELSPVTAAHVRESLGEAVDLILDDGPSRVGIESTVLALDAEPPRLLRPGMITQDQIEAVIGPIDARAPKSGAAHESPGMHPRHYSPRTPLILGEPPDERAAYLWHTRELPAAKALRMPANEHEYAASLYSALHELDRGEFSAIAVEPPPDLPGWRAILDRLRRAAVR